MNGHIMIINQNLGFAATIKKTPEASGCIKFAIAGIDPIVTVM